MPSPLLSKPLEARITPATLSGATSNILTYADLDGDLVTITFSKGSYTEADFTFDKPFDGDFQQLRLIDLSTGHGTSVDTNITMKVKRASTGDGRAAVGHLNATGLDLGDVKIVGDLGRITAGGGQFDTTLQVKSLKVASLGAFGVATQAAGGNVVSVIDGKLGLLEVQGNVQEAQLTAGRITKMTVGGSLVGGAAAGSGQIATTNDMGDVTIKGDLRGGGGASSAQLSAGASLGKVIIGGSLLGGAGGVDADVNSGSGSIVGGKNFISPIVSISIGGRLEGGAGYASGSIISHSITLNVGDLKVKGSVSGGKGDLAGGVLIEGNLKSLSIGGSLLGGSGDFNDNESNHGQVYVAGKLGPVKVGGDLRAGSGRSGGHISAESVGTVGIGGSIVGKTNSAGAGVSSFGGAIGAVKIGGDIDGRPFLGDPAFGSSTFGIVASSQPSDRPDIASVAIGGSTFLADIKAAGQLGAVTIKGNAVDTDITGRGQGVQGATTDIAIKSVSIGGNAERVTIYGGRDRNFDDNPDAQIGAITVGGDWIASDALAGVGNSSNHGDGTDVKGTGTPDTPAIISRIASITIKGAIIGTGGNTTDHFGFVAEEIGAFKVGGVAVLLVRGQQDIFSFSDATGADVTLREL